MILVLMAVSWCRCWCHMTLAVWLIVPLHFWGLYDHWEVSWLLELLMVLLHFWGPDNHLEMSDDLVVVSVLVLMSHDTGNIVDDTSACQRKKWLLTDVIWLNMPVTTSWCQLYYRVMLAVLLIVPLYFWHPDDHLEVLHDLLGTGADMTVLAMVSHAACGAISGNIPFLRSIWLI